MSFTVNQNWVPGWNAIYANLVNKVSKTLITSNRYTSPFSAMLQSMETGNYVEDIHLNPGHVLLQDTVTNSDILNDYTDDIATAIYETDVDLVFPSTYTEYVVRTGFTLLDNVSALITTLVGNIRVTLEFHRNRLVKQMLYNGWQYGMISTVNIADPEQSGAADFAVKLNTLLDDFKTEINPRYVPYNNQKGMVASKYRQTITHDIPYVIVFNNVIRSVEFYNAINLGLVGKLSNVAKFRSGNDNQDWAQRLIFLNGEDFPTSIPSRNRSAVTGQNVPAVNINFFEMPKDKSGQPLFEGKPIGPGTKLAGFVIAPDAFKLFTQLEVQTSWLNPATLRTTNREIYRGIMQLGAFAKIAAITY